MAEVVGIDADPASIDLARQAGGDIEYVLGDFREHDFQAASFDVVTSVASLHHMDAEQALEQMARLVRPGGLLAVIGVARVDIRSLPYEVAGFVAHRLYKRRRGYWQHPSPIVWPPAHTYGEIRRLARRVLPGVRYRRHVLFHYSLLWTKP